MRADSARTATCALDIDVTWGDDTPLYSEHIAPARTFVLRAEQLEGTPDFLVCREWLGAAEHELVSVHEGKVLVRAHEREISLALGEEARVQFGPLTVRVRVVPPQRVPAHLHRPVRDVKPPAWTAASFALHLLALGCMTLMPPKASSLSLDALGEDTRYMRYLNTPVAREPELPWSVPSTSDTSGEAPAHRGEEGQAGRPEAPRKSRRMAVAGHAQQTLPGPPSAAEASRAGILGVLAGHSALAPDSAFHGDIAQGHEALAALGALLGQLPGESFGFGGLGMRGTGRAGGGDAEGSIGVALATRGGEGGYGGAHGLGARGRRERVPVLRVSQAEVRGSLSKEVIRRVIHRHLNEVRFCYEQTLSTHPDLSGRVVVQFMISPSGAVQQAAIAVSTLKSPSTDACILTAVRRWPFPAPDGGGYVSVSYPFLFERAGE